MKLSELSTLLTIPGRKSSPQKPQTKWMDDFSSILQGSRTKKVLCCWIVRNIWRGKMFHQLLELWFTTWNTINLMPFINRNIPIFQTVFFLQRNTVNPEFFYLYTIIPVWTVPVEAHNYHRSNQLRLTEEIFWLGPGNWFIFGRLAGSNI